MLNNICLIVSYDGSAYCGFQKQKHSNTIQNELEKALTKIANHKIEIYCAGRTDTGVHATNQVINFKTSVQRELKSWINGTNSLLPKSIRVINSFNVNEKFHARFSANARRYRYIIENKNIPSPHLINKVTNFKNKLDHNKMHEASQALIGEHDFSSFRASNCQSLTSMRNIYCISITRKKDYIIIDIKANAFLYHMVRNIVGALIIVGQGKKNIDYIHKLLLLKNRSKAPATADADGLYLVEISYPEYPQISPKELGPLTF